ncbi:MAG: hypothetical protein PHE83_05750 [Opitutaceae bacterium]|nr:hypothetical protein [Opitutaceae bacterium]
MKGNHSASTRSALSVIQDERIKCTGGALEALKATAVKQVELIRRQEADSAMRAEATTAFGPGGIPLS